MMGTAPVSAESVKQDIPTQELILLPVQVRDDAGKPVSGLKVGDFRLQIDGKAQPIAVLTETVREGRLSRRDAVDLSDSPANSQRFSSTPAGGMPPEILIVAIDLVNTGFLGKGEAQQQLLEYVTKGLPSDPFELVAITKDGLVPIRSFASPVTLVAKQVGNGDTPGNSAKMQGARLSESESSKLLNLALRRSISGPFAWEIGARASLTALRQLADAYAGVPGRKTVIWLTAGIRAFGGDPTATAKQRGSFQFQVKSPLSTDPQLKVAYDEAFRALNTADMAVYPVDLKLMKGENIYLANYMASYGSVGIVGTFETTDGIKVLAAETGGRACSAAADLKSCIEDALADAGSYYLLGFYVAESEQKSGWHKVELTTTAPSTVRTRSRYFLPGTPASSREAIREYLMNAAKGKTTYSGFDFSVEHLSNAPPPAEDPIRVRIRVPASSIVLQPGEQSLSYEIALVGLSSSGQPMNAVRVVPFNLTPEQTKDALQKGWHIEESWPEIDAMAAIRYVIRDTGTGRIGSVTVPLRGGMPTK